MASRKAEVEPLALTGSPLPEEELEALLRVLRWARGFVLVFVRSNVPVESRQIVVELAERLAGDNVRVRDLCLTAATGDLLAEIRALAPLPAVGEVVVVVGFEHSIPSRISHPPALDRLNRAREHFRELPYPLVLVLPDYALNQLAREAPDFWAWRSGVFATRPAVSRTSIGLRELSSRQYELRSLSLERKKDHLEVLQELLAELERSAVGNEAEKSDLCWRISVLHSSLGDLDDALLYARKAMEHAGEDARTRALVQGQIADIYQDRGELDEALRILQEESLPVIEKLGDVRERAITLGRIADILKDRGELDEALRILQESLPVFEKVGDVRSRAITLGKIADILKDRGELDKALRIRQEEELPVYEKLGDVRERAITLGQIADILKDRGELDEALRIRQEEELPVYEKVGDVRSRAITLGKIADIYQARGELDEALRLVEEESLPVLERLGDQGMKARALWRIAQIELQREEIPSAVGRMSEAYEIFLRLGIPDGIAVVGFSLARLHLDAGRTEEARTVLLRSQDGFAKLGWTAELEETEALLAKLPASGDGE